MKKSLLLIAVLLAAMALGCETTGGAGELTVGADMKAVMTLKATDAELVTTGQLKIEGAHHNIGWWSNTDDLAKWKLDIPEDGTYIVTFTYSDYPTFSGATVKFTVGDQSFDYKVKATDTDFREICSLRLDGETAYTLDDYNRASESNNRLGLIVVPVLFALDALLVVATAVLLFGKKRRMKPLKRGEP